MNGSRKISTIWNAGRLCRIGLSLSLLFSPFGSLGPLAAEETATPQASAAGDFSAPVKQSSKPRKGNPNAPDHEVILGLPDFSGNPTDAELKSVKLLPQPLLPGSAQPLAGENEALAQALRDTVSDKADESLDHLEGFVQQFPQSRWVLSVELSRGLVLYQRGYFLKATDAFQRAWAAGKDEKGVVKPLADLAGAELSQMDCRVGRKEDAKALVKAMDSRKPESTAGRLMEDSRGAVAQMENHPGRSFLCGPFALKNVLASMKSDKANDPFFNKVQSPSTGFNLAQVYQFSKDLGMDLQMAKRSPGAAVLTPAVVNWKLGHYAALVEQKNGMLRSEDPTFGNETWLSEKALDEESTGYCLVAAGPLPDGWQKVGDEEASKVWGKGFVSAQLKEAAGGGPGGGGPGGGGPGGGGGGGCPGCCPGSGSGGGGPGGGGLTGIGMPQANIDIAMIAAVLSDTPLHYSVPVGPAMNFTLTYHGETADPMPGSNFGPNWSFNWQGAIQYSFNGSQVAGYTLNAEGGGEDPVSVLGANSHYLHFILNSTQAFSGGAASGLPAAFSQKMPDGSLYVYGQAVQGLSSVQALLTQVIDPQGNVVTLQYDSLNRLVSIVDAIGQKTTFGYGDSDPMKITQITDPFGRSAFFAYDDSTGHLRSITDQLGLTSSFTYNPPSALSADWIGSMTTPYGTTTFDYTGTMGVDDSVVRQIELTDPMGLKQHAKFTLGLTVPEQFTQLPSGIRVQDYLLSSYFATLYWDKKAMADDPMDPASATMYQWFTTNTNQQSYNLASFKKPLETRIYYNYQGEQAGLVDPNSTFYSPSAQSRLTVDANGTVGTQLNQYIYDAFGHKTNYTDPKGRQFQYTYASNGIDLLSTQDGIGEVLSSATYNSAHLPLTRTDAAGQTTHYSYNSAGQVTSVTTPMGETTYYNYDFRGFLLSMVPPQPGAGVTYTYDNEGRVRTKTDGVSGTLTYSYDSLDRVTQISYPDGTREGNVYDRLDLQSHTDRQGRTTNYGYDADRRMISMTDPKGQSTQYGWCACGSMTSMTDPKGNQTNWIYDLEGRVTQKSYADGSGYGYRYDQGEGKLAFVTDPNHQETKYVNDVDGRALEMDYLNAKVPTPNVSYQYDFTLGRLVGMTDGTGTTSYSYYPIGSIGGNQVQTTFQPVGQSQARVTYTYDADGRVVNRSIDGSSESYSYSNAQLTGVSNPLGSFTYHYDPGSARLTEVDYPNGQKTNYGYYMPSDPLGASGSLQTLTNLGGGSTAGQTLSKFSYTYNPAGDIKTWQQQLDNNPSDAKTYSMGYDADSELQAVTLTGGTSGFDGLAANQAVTYGYDAAGNRTTEYTPQFLHTFEANSLNQLISETDKPLNVVGYTSRGAAVTVNGQAVTENADNRFTATVQPAVGTTTPLTIQSAAADGGTTVLNNHILNTQPLVYDANGSLLADNTYRYSWDAANRLVGITSINPTPPTVADNITFTYDGLSRCVAIVEKHGSTVLTSKTFVWCNLRLCEERNAAGSSVTKRFYDLGEQISGSNYFFTIDHLYSIREMVDSTGAVRARYDYDPWGRATKLSGDLDSDFGFTKFYVNKTTGLDLTLFRAYDPEKGRWLSRDPLGEISGNKMNAEGGNLYRYVLNDPVMKVDKLGLACGPGALGDLNLAEGPDGIFNAACKAHDRCYDTCGRSKNSCDVDFGRNLINACRLGYRSNPIMLSRCLLQAELYLALVAAGGDLSYSSSQASACKKKCSQ